MLKLLDREYPFSPSVCM